MLGAADRFEMPTVMLITVCIWPPKLQKCQLKTSDQNVSLRIFPLFFTMFQDDSRQTLKCRAKWTLWRAYLADWSCLQHNFWTLSWRLRELCQKLAPEEVWLIRLRERAAHPDHQLHQVRTIT